MGACARQAGIDQRGEDIAFHAAGVDAGSGERAEQYHHSNASGR